MTNITVHDRLGANPDLFEISVDEAIGFHISDDEFGFDASGLKADLEELAETCPRCNKEESGKGAVTVEIDYQPYNLCRTHFSYYLGVWPYAEYVLFEFNNVDSFYKRQFRGLAHPNIEHKLVLVTSKRTKFKKDESSGSVWRYFNDKVVKDLGGRWIPSQNGWLFHEDKEWVEGGWRINGERAEGEWRLR